MTPNRQALTEVIHLPGAPTHQCWSECTHWSLSPSPCSLAAIIPVSGPVPPPPPPQVINHHLESAAGAHGGGPAPAGGTAPSAGRREKACCWAFVRLPLGGGYAQLYTSPAPVMGL
ncbi:hypothetical protein AAFF_G00025370 [Aldrovandia affinis]|uniref:Uncharacterized protein n=1 Tax=Aldrovandia affinis TaxID=143900 RepID=A0AAD7S4U4_9TELE|nr:hypothetical protein AAFF_G00025370 [Aldrovandia affinis]